MQEKVTLKAVQANSQLAGPECDENASPLFVAATSPWLIAPAAIKMPALQNKSTRRGRDQKLFH
jgi:hypothetical protein